MPSNFTDVVPAKLVPVIVTELAVTGPLDGRTDVIIGDATYVYAANFVTEPPGVVNTTSTEPGSGNEGVVTVTDVALTLDTVPALVPKVTPVVPVRLVPVIVTVVPPAVGPPTGDTVVIVGAAI